ncbi:hypothetical protein C8R43DRAFT_600739 [Mycena crocata]|nr:hypothetical protein C8R43DRAFT_600739 [Mycena crocata]
MPRPQTLIFVGLNATRFLSIVALLLVFSSSILVMVNNIKAVNRFQANRITNSTDVMLECDYIVGSTVPNQPAGVFWAVVASLLIIFQVVILLFSELGWPAVFFDRFFPVLGANFGLGALGIFQCLIGAQILSHHVDEFTLVSAFFLFSIGCLNMLLGLVFREDAKSKRVLRNNKPDATKGIIAPPFVNASPQFAPTAAAGPPFVLTGDADAVSFASWKNSDMAKAAYGFGRQGEKAGALHVARSEEQLPRYASPSPAPSAPSEYSAESDEPESYPTPIFARAPSPREHRAPSPRSHRTPSNGSRSHRARRPSPSPARSTSSRGSASSRSASSDSDRSSSSFASPMSYRETIHIPDSPRPETPPPFPAARYQRNAGAF